MTLGVYVLHTDKDDPEQTQATITSIQPELGSWGKLYVTCNGKGERQLPHLKNVVTIRHFTRSVDAAAVSRTIKDYPSDVMVLMKSGVTLCKGVIARLVTALSDTSIGIVGPQLAHIDESLTDIGGLVSVKFVRDWCWAFRHDLVEVVGYLDWVGQAYLDCPGSDVDLCYRARQHGFRVEMEGEALAMVPAALTDERWSSKAREWLVRKHTLAKIDEVW